jgi:prephenate dehydrogenase
LERFGTVAIVGVGLIGGSIGLALRARGSAGRIIGVGRDPGRLDTARRLGAIDGVTTDPDEAAAAADVIVVCTPVDRVGADVIRAAHAANPRALVTDAGSTKRSIVEAAEADESARAKFVAAHPIAGSERSGAAHARADLFEGRVCVLTPTDRTPPDRLDRARAFWSSLGCTTVDLDPTTHDAHLARTSHLPHAVAAALASLVGPDLVPLAAGAYRDGTRVAGADAALWAPIFLENRRAVVDALDAFDRSLASFRAALEEGDEQTIRAWWDAARGNRLAFDAQNESGGVASPGQGR